MLYIDIELYFADVVVFFNHKDFDIKRLNRIIKKSVKTADNPKECFKASSEYFIESHKSHFIDNNYGGIHAWYNNVYVIIVDECDFLSASFHDKLSHEIRHCTDRILLDCALSNCWENREAFAYLQGYISKHCYKYLLEKHKKYILTGINE